MSFILEALKDKPLALYLLDDTSPFQDYSGYGRTATSASTPDQHLPLCSGADYGSIFDSNTVATFSSPVFNQGTERQSFSLEAWVRVIRPGAEQQVLGNQGVMDGLTVSDKTVSFVTKYQTAPEARATYELESGQTVHLVGIHTGDKNILMVNGAVVAETSLTEEQQNDSFVNTTSSLYAGASSGTQAIAMNGVGIYGYALSSTAAFRHYQTGIELPRTEEVVSFSGGDGIALSRDNANISFDFIYDSEDEWLTGTMRDVVLEGDTLLPQFIGIESIAGEWVEALPLDATGSPSIYGVSLNWRGEGVTIEASLNGSTWELAERGHRLDLIPNGFDPTDKQILIRVSFAGGIVNDPSFLSMLRITGFENSKMIPTHGRIISLSDATPQSPSEHFHLADDWGTAIESGGSLSVAPDPAVPDQPYRTIELWIKATSATPPTISASGTSYVNGTPASITLPRDVWTLVHIVTGSTTSAPFTVLGEAQVGYIGVYESAKTAAEIAEIYTYYFGTNVLRVGDNSVVGIAESSTEVSIYAHDWSIQASG